MAMDRFKQNRMAVFCFYILVLLYGSALFADFLSPYSYKNEAREYSYSPPTPIQFINDGHLSWPYVYGYRLIFNEYQRRIYLVDSEKKYPLKLFAKGDDYKLLGLIPTSYHLFTVEAPARIYLLGADARGRDVYSRLLYGSRISLSIGIIGVAISFTLGLIIGGIAGYYGGRVDSFLMRVSEMFMMAPGFYLLLALRSAVPDDFNSIQIYFSIVIILSFIGWAGLARIIRGMCLSLKERDYVLAAKTYGMSDLAIIIKHILPHTISYTIYALVLSVPGYILGESVLSLFGLGIQDPFASWGNMLSDAMSIIKIRFYPWILWPAFLIFLTIISYNIMGDALRDSLDPNLKGEKEGEI